jgi:hypothetical protein
MSIKGDNGVRIYTPESFYTNINFDVLPNVPKIISGSMLSQYFELQNLMLENISASDLIQKGLPPGNYKICFRLVDSDFIVRTPDDPAGCSASFQLREAEPPQTVNPACGQQITYGTVPNIVFNWTPAIGAPSFTLYTLKIVEISDSLVPPENAMQTATDPPFFEQQISGYMFLYGPGQPLLDVTKKYAWQVIASDLETNTQFINEGKSPVCWFSLKEFTGIVPLNQTPESPVSPALISSATALVNIPFATIKGKLEWAFRKSEEGTGILETEVPVLLNSTYNAYNSTVVYDPNVTVVSQSLSANYFSTGNAATGSVYQQATNTVVNTDIIGNKKTVFEKKQELINQLASSVTHPLQQVKVEFRLYIKNEVVQIIKILNQVPGGLTGPLASLQPSIFLGVATTDNSGNLQYSFIDPVAGDLDQYYTLNLVIHDPHFEFSVDEVPFSVKDGAYDIGTLKGLARTYRFKPIVKDQDGKKIESAKLTILRDASFFNYYNAFPNLIYEGLRDPAFLASKNYVAEGKTNNIFKRMFVSTSMFDAYQLKFEAEGFPAKTFYFSAGTNKVPPLDSSVPLVEQTFIVTANNPIVKGRVLSKDNELPLADITVFIRLSDNSSASISTKTGPDGRFTISNIPPNSVPYTLYVNTGIGATWKDPAPLYLNKKGIIEIRDPIFVNAQLYAVKAVVTDINSIPLNQAMVIWASGGKAVYSDVNGLFITSHPLGKDTLIVSHDGYRDALIPVDLKKPTLNFQNISPGNKAPVSSSVNDWEKLLKSLGGGGANSGDQLALNLGYLPVSAYGSSQVMYADLFGSQPSASPDPSFIINLDTIKLKKFYVLVTVRDETSKSILPDSRIYTSMSNPPAITDSKGQALLQDVPYGTASFTVYGPSGNVSYIPLQQQVAISSLSDTAQIIFDLAKGASVSGKVYSNQIPVKGARVLVVGKEYIYADTDVNGEYHMPGIPLGNQTLRAVKSAYIADEKKQNFALSSYTVDFNLIKPDFDASKLLGFNIEIYHSASGSTANEYIIDGAFTGIPSNSLFALPSGSKLEFPEITIVKNNDGSIQPKSGSVSTMVSELSFKLWNYLDVIAYEGTGITVSAMNNDMKKGLINAFVKLNVNAPYFNKSSFLKYPGSNLNLINGGNDKFAIFSSEGTLPSNSSEFGLKSSSAAFSVYNISLNADLPNSKVNANGIDLRGTLTASNLPGIGSLSLKVDQCVIDKKGDVSEVKLNVNPKPQISLYTWQLELGSATLNQFGFKFGGTMKISVPQTSPLNIGFSNLSINTSGINGGAFYFPSNVSLLGVVNYTSVMGNSFQLGKVPGKNAYKLTGAGMINFSKLLTDNMPLNLFSIATSGDVELSAKPEFNYDIVGVAKFNISKININTALPEIGVAGKLELYLPGFNVGAGGNLRFRKNNFAAIDDFSFLLSLNSIGSVGASVGFTGKGFKGSGKLKMANSDVAEISTDFLYEKLSTGLNLKIKVVPGLPPIPLVASISLENIGGAVALNTSSNIYSVSLSGRIVVAPSTSALVSLDPVAITVTASSAGPVLQGEATMKLLSWSVGKAQFMVDYPSKLILCKAKMGAGFNLLPGVSVSGNQEILFATSAKPSDLYWITYVYAGVNLINGLVNGNGLVVAAWGLDKTKHPEYSQYYSFIPANAWQNNKLNGVNIYADLKLGVEEKDADCLNLTLGSICGYAYNYTKGVFYSNFFNQSIGVSVESNWQGGGWADVFGFKVAGVKVSVAGDLSGGHNQSDGWYFSGSAKGKAIAWAGCCGSSCATKTCWECCHDTYLFGEVCPCLCGAKICVKASVKASISEKKGSSVGIDLF